MPHTLWLGRSGVYRIGIALFCAMTFPFFAFRACAHPEQEAPRVWSGAAALAAALLNQHPYLIDPADREQLASWLSEDGVSVPVEGLAWVLSSVRSTLEVNLGEDSQSRRHAWHPVILPGDRGGILFLIVDGEGPTVFRTSQADLALTEGLVSIPVASPGTTWTLLSLENVPDGFTSLFASLDQDGTSIGTFPFQVNAPVPGRLELSVISDDDGLPAPFMVQLKWGLDGSLRPPDNALDFTAQFDSQAAAKIRPDGSRLLDLPGVPEGDYWVSPGPIDMMLPPGEWEVSVLRGLEHLPVVETIRIEPGRTVQKTLRPERWVDMASRGWISGDDHVHARVMNGEDAARILTWARAEDLRVVNVLEMGDHARTYFQQRAFGPAGRIHENDTNIVPGQEDPRIGLLGHTIALNISGPIRDTSRYYLHDWYYDQAHQLGGLYGYAHVNRGLFNVHRDLALNLPRNKVDFVEVLQFHELGTTLYYAFLNLGFKVTASAGSDVPWGATMGEVRVYGFVGDQEFSADSWFRALEAGRTFVTNGPMIAFSIDQALPGDEILIGEDRTTVTVRARTWGHPDRATPVALEVVRFGEAVQSATGPVGADGELQLEFDFDVGPGCWLAARARAADGSVAHSTPIYLTRESLRSWDFERVPSLIDRRMRDLDELDQLIAEVKADEVTGPLSARTGLLAGAWYGNADLTRPAGTDTLHLPDQSWPAQGERGGVWSAQWKGLLSLPEDFPGTIDFILDSSGPSSLSIGGRQVVAKEGAGEAAGRIELDPGRPSEIHLSYVNQRSPRSYLSLFWSADGNPRQPVPGDWISYRDEDRSAFRFAEGTGLESVQLRAQSAELSARIAAARAYYEGLRTEWAREKPIREARAGGW